MVQEARNESYFRTSTVDSEPNKRLVSHTDSEQQYGEEYIYEGLTNEDEFIVTMGRHNNALQRVKSKLSQKPMMFMHNHENVILSTEMTKGEQEQIKKLSTKIFYLLPKN